MRALVFGEILYDRITQSEYAGGAPFNVAAHLARNGVDVMFISRVGDDERGHTLISQAKSYGIHTDCIQIDTTHPTSVVDVIHDENKSPDFTIRENVAWDYIEFDKRVKTAITNEPFDILYYGTLAQRNSQSEQTLARIIEHAHATHTLYDINIRKRFFTEDILKKSLHTASIVKLNTDEVLLLRDLFALPQSNTRIETAKALQETFTIDTLCVTAGDEGAFVLHDGVEYSEHAHDVHREDTTGAGDGFASAFVYTYIETRSIQKALEKAVRFSEKIISHTGALSENKDDGLFS